MICFFNLVFAFFFPGLVEWWSRWNGKTVVQNSIDQGDLARALAALAGILVLGLGGVLIIGMSGRWLRRWAFKNPERTSESSAVSSLEKVNWAAPKNDLDPNGIDGKSPGEPKRD